MKWQIGWSLALTLFLFAEAGLCGQEPPPLPKPMPDGPPSLPRMPDAPPPLARMPDAAPGQEPKPATTATPKSDENEGQQALEWAWATFSTIVGPAAAASLLVMLGVRWLGGQRVGSLAALLAVAAAFCLGGVCVPNNVSHDKPWQLNPDRPLEADDFFKVLGWSLEQKPKPPPNEDGESSWTDAAEEDDGPQMPNNATRYWLPWLGALAMLAEILLISLAVPAAPAWVVRTFVALLAGRLLTPFYLAGSPHNPLRIQEPWVSWALAFVILLEWALLTSLARRWKDGVIATSLGLCCVAAGMVCILSSYTSACEWVLLLGASLAGPALVSWKWPSDTSPAIAIGVVMMPALLLEAQIPAEKVPLWSFLLAGLAPLALLPVWLPFLARKERWTRWLLVLILPLIPAGIAVFLATRQ